jgi:hypothetical protein
MELDPGDALRRCAFERACIKGEREGGGGG